LGCSVPLSAVPPHVENSVKVSAPMLTLQSTEFGMQTLLFQSWPTFGEYASLLNVLTLNGRGRPAGPESPGWSRSFPRLKRYDTRCVLLREWSIFTLYFLVVSSVVPPGDRKLFDT